MTAPRRVVVLRDERDGRDSRSLRAFVDQGCLHLEGHDLGPATAPISSDGEYEWSFTYAAKDIPSIVALLEGAPGNDVLDILEHWVGRSYELEARLRASGIPHKFWSWSG